MWSKTKTRVITLLYRSTVEKKKRDTHPHLPNTLVHSTSCTITILTITILYTKCWALLNSLWKISSTRCSRFVFYLTRTVSLEKCCETVMRRLKIPFLYSAKIQIYNSRQVTQMEHCKLHGVHCCLE